MSRSINLIVGICFHCKLPIYQYPEDVETGRNVNWYHFAGQNWVKCEDGKAETSAQPSNLFWAKQMEVNKELWQELTQSGPRDSIEIAPQEGDED